MPNANVPRIVRSVGLALGLAVAAAAAPATAEAWKPDHSVEVVVGVSPGGSMDFTARLVRDLLVKEGLIPQSSIVNNKPGGGHAVALAYTMNHKGDPNYIEIVNTPLVANNLLGRSPIKYTDFTPIAMLFDENMVFAVKPDSKIKDAQDLLTRLKDAPDSVTFSVSSGLGTANHAAVMQVAEAAGIDVKKLKTVAFNSSSEGVTATLGGHIDVVVTTARSLLPYRQSGDLRFLAVASSKRLPGEMADVPTWRELGADAVVTAWRGVVAPPGLTPEQTEFWSEAIHKITQTDEWKQTLDQEFMTDNYMDSKQTGDFFKQETDHYAAMIKALGVSH